MTDSGDINGSTIKNYATDSYSITFTGSSSLQTKDEKYCCAKSSGIISIPDVVLSNDSNLTVTFWMRTNHFTTQNTSIMYDRNKGIDNYPMIILKNSINDNLIKTSPYTFKVGMYINTANNGAYQEYYDNDFRAVGEWVHYAIVFEHGVGYNYYTNAVKQTIFNNFGGSSNYTTYYGMSSDPNSTVQTMQPDIQANVDFYDLRMYTHALTQVDVSNIYQDTLN